MEQRMDEKQLRELIKALRDVANEYSSSPEKARQFLMEAGIITATGELAEPYRS